MFNGISRIQKQMMRFSLFSLIIPGSPKKMLKKAACILFLIICIFSFSACGGSTAETKNVSETTTEKKSYDDIVNDILTCYGSDDANKDEQYASLFSELEEEDSLKAELVQGILDYCDYLNSDDFTINDSVLPDGLPETNELCIVVLGYQLNDDGSMKNELKGRLNVALNCAEKYPNAYILVTGGGTAKNNKTATEADQMAEYLEKNGVSSERIIIENKSLTTVQNAIFSEDILRENYPEVTSIAIVSSDYHIGYGSLLFEAYSILTEEKVSDKNLSVISNAAYKTSNKPFSVQSQMKGFSELLSSY